jgi:hypothetical protein
METNAPSKTSDSSHEPTCPCGYNRHHPMVQAKGEYTAWGHFLVTFGISYRPLKVKYQCLKCDAFFDETTDSGILNEFS